MPRLRHFHTSCPECGSYDVSPRSRTRDLICRRCNHTFKAERPSDYTQVGMEQCKNKMHIGNKDIIPLLKQEYMSITELSRRLDARRKTVSHWITEYKKLGIVEAMYTGDARIPIYRLTTRGIESCQGKLTIQES